MKQCGSCGQVKPLSDFHKRSAATDGTQNRCKECNKKQRLEYYRTAKGKASNTLVGQRARIRNSRFLYEYLLSHPCVDCGESDPIVLEFDHIDRTTKLFTISGRDVGLNRLMEEISKCEVRCANCHRRRTAQQFAWSKHEWYNSLGA